MITEGQLLWSPSATLIEACNLTQFMRYVERTRGLTFAGYEQLWQWSVDQLEDFWETFWLFSEIESPTPYVRVLDQRTMPGAKWFEGARLNMAQLHLNKATAARPAMLFKSEREPMRAVSWEWLTNQVASVAAHLRACGVRPGDRVVAYLPNIPETVVAFLATASVGGVWSMCSPDMGPTSILDRFQQITPKFLFTCDGYVYSGKAFNRLETVAALLAELPTVEHVALIPYLEPTTPASALPHATLWASIVAKPAEMNIESVPFDHPLWIVYSSGTTGIPKAIVHGHGGASLELLKMLCLHLDVREADVFHWFSSTGWVMWNLQVAGLAAGATIAIFDGNPGYPTLDTLWEFAGEAKLTFFGAGAAFYTNCMKAGIRPNAVADLSALRSVGSTGSPLSAEAYDYVQQQVGHDVWINPISGGTDFASAFVGGCPLLPVYAGEMQCRVLGADVHAFDEMGRAVVDQVGELVCIKPIPSMPLYFWNDPAGTRLHESYFDMYPGMWRHGDWMKITPRGGAIIYGRSDATINRHGIRMGTAELYRVVEEMPEVADSLVVDLEYLGRESYMPLFVVLRAGEALTEALKSRINSGIRERLSARHVPNDIISVADVPRTLTGKKMELPIKKLMLGQPIAKIANPDAMANPGSLTFYARFAEEYLKNRVL
jgi:acetoacetyl-CoA synthetase